MRHRYHDEIEDYVRGAVIGVYIFFGSLAALIVWEVFLR